MLYYAPPVRMFDHCAKVPASYTDYAGLRFPVDLCIAALFSRQIAIGNAGPSLALESMGGKPFFRHHFVNIAPIYKQ